MRVAHLLRKYNPAEWGGTETALQRLFEGLQPQGVESVLYAPRCKTAAGRDPLAEVGCKIRRFRACVPIVGPSREEKNQWIAVGGNLMSFDLIRNLWREPALDVIHAHTLGRIGGIGLTVAKRRKLPFVVTIHGGLLALPDALRESFENPDVGGWEWGKLFGALLNSRRVLADADAILTCNQREAELLREKYPGKRIQVQPHGVPLNLFTTDYRQAALNAFPNLRGKQILLVPGRIDSVKNQGWVVEQAPELFRKHRGALLVFVGACTDKEYGQQIESRIKALGLADRVLLLGALPPGDPRLIGLFQQAAAVVLSSVSETFGLIVLEAWAAGAPVIASRTPGASALIRHAENGWLFDLANPASFHEAIDAALLRPEVAGSLASSGHQLVAREYDSAVLATRLKELYQELSETKRGLRRAAGPLSSPSAVKPELVHH